MAFSGRPTSTNLLTQLINQPAHGFTQIGTILVYSNALGRYVLSQADSLLHCLGSVMISILIDANSFYITQNGYVSGLPTAFTTGLQYYVSPAAAGTLTAIEPFTAGEVILPCFVADTTHSGIFYTGSGELVQPGGIQRWFTNVAVNTNMVINAGYSVTANCALTLPAASSVGDELTIVCSAGTGFTIAQNNPAQTIIGAGGQTTPGAGGSVVANTVGTVVQLVCITANTTWQILTNNVSVVFN